jgi:hypothetical protein
MLPPSALILPRRPRTGWDRERQDDTRSGSRCADRSERRFSDTFGGQRFTWHAVVVDDSGSAMTAATEDGVAASTGTIASTGTTSAAADDNDDDYPGY